MTGEVRVALFLEVMSYVSNCAKETLTLQIKSILYF